MVMSFLRVARGAWRGRAAWEGVLSFSSPSFLLPSSASHHTRLTHGSAERRTGYLTLLVSVGGIAGFASALQYLHSSSSSEAYCRHAPTTSETSEHEPSNAVLPQITLYEYPACPFCSKVKAFLKCYDVRYRSVSVNPVNRKEIKFSENKKVPFIMADGQQVQLSTHETLARYGVLVFPSLIYNLPCHCATFSSASSSSPSSYCFSSFSSPSSASSSSSSFFSSSSSSSSSSPPLPRPPFYLTQIHDSSVIISVLRTCHVKHISISEALQLYPEMTITDRKGKSTTERSNKYFVMYGEEPTASTVGERRYGDEF